MAFDGKRPSWRSASNKRNFQRELAAEVVKPYSYPENRNYGSDKMVSLVDMRHVAFSRHTLTDQTVMGMAMQLGWSHDQVLSFEARARALDAGERYFAATNTHASEEMLQAFEAIWVSGEFFVAYDFFSTVKKVTIRASTRRT